MVIDHVLPVAEIARWMKPYLTNDRGLAPIAEVLRHVHDTRITFEIEKVIGELQLEG